MADRAASSAALRKQWNQRAPGGGHTPAARRSWLGLYGVVLLALVGLLVWRLMQPGQRVYVALLAEKYGPDLAVTEKKEVELLLQPTIDPAAVFERDVSPLEKAIGEKQLVLRNLARQGTAKQIASELPKYLAEAVGRAWELDKVELLVLYVHAHGLSIDGVPYLLWNEDLAGELRRTQGKPSLYPLAELLKSASGLGAQRTLLVLDCGELTSEPRLGMFVNEFPKLLEQEMAAGGYSDKLWVMCGHSPLETAHVWADDRRSVFGHFVIEALSKPGDSDKDLTAAAFFRRVHDGVERAALRGSGAPQHPMFLVGGKGKVKPQDVPTQVILKSLFFVSNEASSESGKTDESSKPCASAAGRGPLLAMAMSLVAQAEKSAESKTPAAAPVGAEKKEEPKKPESAAAAEKAAPAKLDEKKPVADATPAPDTAAPATTTAVAATDAKPPERDPFLEIWDLCRELEDPDNRGVRWSPVDYAPHLWSRFRRQLVWYQLRATIEGGLAQNAANRQYIERSIRDPLRELSKAGTNANVSATGAIPILGRVIEVRRQFFEDAARRQPGGYASAATPDEPVANFARARRVANAIQFAAAECVRLYGFNLHAGESDRYALLVRAIGDAATLRRELEGWEGKPLDDRGLDWTETRDRCDEHLRAYLSLRSSLQDELRILVDARLQFGTLPRVPREQFQRRATPQIEDPSIAHWVDLTLRLGEAGWTSRSGDVAGAYLLGLPALASNRGLERHLATLAKVTANLRADADLWEVYREVGSALRQAGIALPRLIADASPAASDPAAERLAEVRLRLLDPADAEDESLVAARNPISARTWFPLPGPKLEITAGTTIDLRPGERRDVSLAYQWTGDDGAEATVELAHAGADGASLVSIVPGRSTITLSRSGTLSGFAVKAPVEAPSGPRAKTTTEVIYTVRVGSRSFTSPPVPVRMVGEDFVDLVINQATDENKPAQDVPLRADERDIGSGPRAVGERATLVYHRLSPYPRGVATYRFSLQSGGGKADQRNVEVEVWRVATATDRDKKNEFDPRGELKPGVAERIDALSRRMPLKLGEKHPYHFDVDPAKKAAEKEAEKAAEKEAEKAPEKSKADANNGGGQNDAPAGDPKAADPKAAAKPPADAKPPAIDFGGGLIIRVEETTPADGGGPRVWFHWVEFQPLHPRQYVTSTATYDAARHKLKIKVLPNRNLPYPPDGFLVEWEAAETNADITGWRGSPSDRGTRQRDSVSLELENFVPKSDNETLDVFVAVDGYPRAFYHPVMVGGGAVPTPSTATFRRVRVVAPANTQVFAGDPDAVDPFPILVEARFDDIPEERDKIQVTFDDGPPITLPSSRARHALFTAGKNGAAAFEIRVGDYVRDVRRKTDGDAIRFTTTSRDKIIPITAEIVGVSESYRDTPPTRSVLVDYRDPTVTAAPPRPSQVTQKKPEKIELAAIAADEGGVERVEYYLVGQDKSRLDEEDLVKKNLMATWRMERPKLGESGPRPMSYNTEKLEVGTYWVWAIAFDRVKRKSLETRLGSFRVNEPAPAGDKKVAGVTIRGQAVYNSSSRDGITITLSTPDGANVDSTQPAGEADPNAPAPLPGQRPPRPQFWFTFKDVPPGKYVLTAKGTEKTPDGRGGPPRKLVQLDKVPFEVKPSDKGTVTLDKPIKLTADR